MAGSDDEVAASGAGKVESKLEKLDIDDSTVEARAKVGSKPSISFSIWPPSERTRKAIVSRLIENLTIQSPISKRYGTLSAEEAEVTAKQVEEESFTVAGGDKKVDDDGIEVLQVYSKEISKRMLEVLKARSGGNADMEKEGSVNEKVASSATDEVESESS